jgi:hypothetical protein
MAQEPLAQESELKPNFVGINSLNSFIANISAPRSVMFFNHFAQRPNLIKPDSRLVKSGAEYELGKYINDVKVEENCIVRDVVSYIPDYKYGLSPIKYILVEYEKDYGDTKRIIIDCIEVPVVQSTHTKFGYELKVRDEFNNNNLFNKTIAKDSIIATSSSCMEDGSYGFGLNANVVFMSHPGTSEDGFVVSESFVNRAKISVVEKRVINITSDIIGLNIFGDDKRYKMFPDINEPVRDDGVVFAYRKRNDYFSIADLTDENLKRIDPIFDTAIYVTPGSKVVNIEVVANATRKNILSNKINEQLEEYYSEYIQCYKVLIEKVETLHRQKAALFRSADMVELSPRLHVLITNAKQIIHASNPANRIKLLYKKMPVTQYRLVITTLCEVTPTIGFKLTCCHGGKGVICSILPDDHMPVDAAGNRADVIVDQGSTISRMNISRTYEAYFGGLARDTRNKIIESCAQSLNITPQTLLSNPEAFITEKEVQYVQTYLHGLYKLFSIRMSKFIEELSFDKMRLYLLDILKNQLSFYIPTDNEITVVDAIKAIEQSPYKPIRDYIKYKDFYGRDCVVRSKTQIGNFYIMFLDKIADSYMAVSSSRVNNFGFPIKVSPNEKNKFPHSQTPVRSLGETETRIMVSYSSPIAVAEMYDLNTNPTSHKLAVSKILQSDKLTRIENIVDRKDITYGNTRPLAILKHLFNCAGMNFRYIPESESKKVEEQ